MSRRRTVGMCALVAIVATLAGFFASAFAVAMLDRAMPTGDRAPAGPGPRHLAPERTAPASGPGLRYVSMTAVPAWPSSYPLLETHRTSRS